MQYIVDFIDSATEQAINTWLQTNVCTVIKTFSHFSKTYLVQTETSLVADALATHVNLDNESTAIKLLDVTYTSPSAYSSFSIDTNNENDWWKTVSFQGALNHPQPDAARQGFGYAVYLMDSGVDITHPEFADAKIRNLHSLNGDFTDTTGHGTALASLVVGKTCGITNAELVSVKVFQNNTPTLISDVLNALDAIAVDYIQNYNNVPAVINMSWSINRNSYVDNKIGALLNLGLVGAAAAGNSGIPIQDVTPAAITNVLSVGSINTNLEPSSFSNYTGPLPVTQDIVNLGPGLDLWAPGEHIYVALPGGIYNLSAGTSMATAIVSALCIYNFAFDNLSYGTIISNRGSIALDNPESIPVITINRGTLQNTIVTGGGYTTKENIEVVRNVIFPKHGIVHLSEKYKDCTNSVLVAVGLSSTLSEIRQKLQEGVISLNEILHKRGTTVAKNVQTNITFVQVQQFDSFTLGDLPIGLSLVNGQIVGKMNEDLGTDKFKTYVIPLKLIRGTEELNSSFTIIYYDASIINSSYTSQQFQEDANMKLFTSFCNNCGSYTICDGICNPMYACSDKTIFESCNE